LIWVALVGLGYMFVDWASMYGFKK